MSQLTIGTELNSGKYVIQSVLGQGGFGITYLAVHRALEKQVVIKEFFMRGYMSRQLDNSIKPDTLSPEEYDRFKLKFLEEARLLAKFDENPYIVDVIDHFEENKTAYFVMPYVKGISLTDFAAQQTNGRIIEGDAIKIMRQLAIALSDMHKKQILHRDIKPDNVLVTEKGSIILIDFGAAREHITAEFAQKHSIMLTPGYAPPEQYDAHADRGAFTDIYSLGALMYRLLTGVVPTAAPSRQTQPLKSPRELNPLLSNGVNDTIMKAMELDAVFRFQSVTAFINALMQPSSQPNVVEEKPKVEPPIIKEEVKEVTPPPLPPQPEKEPTPIVKPKAEEEEQIKPLDLPEELEPAKPKEKPKPKEQPKEKPQPVNQLQAADDLLQAGKAEEALAIYKNLFEKDSSNKKLRERIKTCQDSIAAQEAAKATNKRSLWKKVGYGVGALAVGGIIFLGWQFGNFTEKIAHVGGDVPEMQLIEGGSYFMGMVGKGQEDEKPLHQVSISPYYIGVTEVTQGQWKAFCKKSYRPLPPNVPKTSNDDRPIYNVTRKDAMEYCAWLSKETGKKFRLPTEAEWEYAAKGGRKSKANNLYSGGNDANAVACFEVTNVCPVKQKRANELGLYDMSGNVWEWCSDWYSKSYYKDCIRRTQSGELVQNPKGPNIGHQGVLRGGAYNGNEHDLRVSDRLYQVPNQYRAEIPMGFRVVQEIVAKKR
ncbi:MAG: SUMF1/EgtB/PvdO family nonheme iron enzyme [Bacteroidia bacterium]